MSVGWRWKTVYAINWAKGGWLQYHANDNDGALDALMRAARLADRSIMVQLMYVRALEKFKPDAEARAVYLKVLEMQRSYRNSDYFNSTLLHPVSLNGLSVPDPKERVASA